VRQRLIELFHYQKNRLAYRQRTEIAVDVDIVNQIELEGNFPEANYAFDNGVLHELFKLGIIVGRWKSFMRKAKQINGLESFQVRKEEAVKRHFRLSCVAQSLLQRVACLGQKSKRFKFTQQKQTIGQCVYSLNREALANLLSLSENLFAQGQSSQNILELLMPA
jgi:hypothetical protein